MDYAEAVEIVIARTKHERFRYLCSDDNPNREAWRAHVISEATGEPRQPAITSNPTVQRQRLLATLVKACPYRENTSSCGCGASKCHAAWGSSRIDPQAANMQDCLDCVLTLLPDHFASV